jgi:hypothetical protein
MPPTTGDWIRLCPLTEPDLMGAETLVIFTFGAGSAGRIPDGQPFRCLPFRFMNQAARSPLVRSFERHLRALNRSERTIATYLISLRQAEAFLRAHGTSLEAATRADLEAFMADVLARGRAPAQRRPTTRCSSSCTPGWSKRKRYPRTRWPGCARRSCPTSRSRSCRRMPSSACSQSVPATASRPAETPRC